MESSQAIAVDNLRNKDNGGISTGRDTPPVRQANSDETNQKMATGTLFKVFARFIADLRAGTGKCSVVLPKTVRSESNENGFNQ